MASDYGLNFGFRVSDETRRSSNGRVRTPKTGAPLLIGTAVEQDPAAPGFLRVAAANAAIRPGTCGLLVQEEVWDRPLYGQQVLDSFSLGQALPNRLSVITNGAGTKVWFKNTPGQTRADGRVIPAVTMYVTAGVAVGRGLVWNGTSWADAGATSLTDPSVFMEVSYYDASTGLVEAFLTR